MWSFIIFHLRIVSKIYSESKRDAAVWAAFFVCRVDEGNRIWKKGLYEKHEDIKNLNKWEAFYSEKSCH